MTGRLQRVGVIMPTTCTRVYPQISPRHLSSPLHRHPYISSRRPYSASRHDTRAACTAPWQAGRHLKTAALAVFLAATVYAQHYNGALAYFRTWRENREGGRSARHWLPALRLMRQQPLHQAGGGFCNYILPKHLFSMTSVTYSSPILRETGCLLPASYLPPMWENGNCATSFSCMQHHCLINCLLTCASKRREGRRRYGLPCAASCGSTAGTAPRCRLTHSRGLPAFRRRRRKTCGYVPRTTYLRVTAEENQRRRAASTLPELAGATARARAHLHAMAMHQARCRLWRARTRTCLAYGGIAALERAGARGAHGMYAGWACAMRFNVILMSGVTPFLQTLLPCQDGAARSTRLFNGSVLLEKRLEEGPAKEDAILSR